MCPTWIFVQAGGLRQVIDRCVSDGSQPTDGVTTTYTSVCQCLYTVPRVEEVHTVIDDRT